MNTLLITPAIESAIVTAADAARVQRDSLLKQSSEVTTVKDRIDADDATNVLRTLKAYTNEIESARVLAKAPALDISRKIDALAKELTDKVRQEETRIARVIGEFEFQERKKAEAARIEAENRAADIARRAREDAEAARRKATTEEAAARASDAVVEKAAAEIVQIKQAAANAVAPKQAGTSVRENVCFEVDDIKALYDAYPALVTLEPNGNAIRAILRANPNMTLPGVRSWREAKLSI